MNAIPSYQAVRDQRLNLRSKMATLGGEAETAFEQAFASLAYTYIKDRAPKLLEYMVGFQLVDRNDDNTRAIGVFGFKVGKSWVYAPVFFLNGDLKGHELLYLKQQDMFVPMKENWINYILAKKPHILGEAEPRTIQELGILQPDIRQMSIPPYNSKYGSHEGFNINLSGWKEDFADFAPIYGALTVGKLEDSFRASLIKHSEFSTAEVLKRVVRENLGLCKIAMEFCETFPAIGQGVTKFHGKDFFKDALLHIRDRVQNHKKQASPILSQRARTRPIGASSILGEPSLPKIAAGPPVEIIVQDTLAITENGTQLTDYDGEEYNRLLRDGHLVRDRRTGEEVSKAYNTQIKTVLSNPSETGLYSILQKPGEFVDSVIIANPYCGKGTSDFVLAIRLEPKDWVNAHRLTLYARPNTSSREDWDKWFEGLPDTDKLSKGGVYSIVSKRRQGSCPFRVKEDMGDGRYRVTFLDQPDKSRPKDFPVITNVGRHSIRMSMPDYEDTDFYTQDIVHLNDREGSNFKATAGTLYAPKDRKVITLKKPEKPPGRNDDLMSDYVDPKYDTKSDNSSFVPGNWDDLQLQIWQKSSAMKIYANGNQVSINGGDLISRRAGLFTLITDHGLREKEAARMIKQAERDHLRGKPAHFRIKYAQPPTQMVGLGPNAPSIPDPQFGTENAYGPTKTQYPETYEPLVTETSADLTDPEIYNPYPEAMPDPMAAQTAQSAASMGQKEVFDTAMITNLLRAVRQDSLVDRYMGDLLKALDRLGRILFMFYWHNDEFMDRYGKSDMPELEDSLRNSFETLGDLVLYLKERDVEPLGANIGQPEIDDAAG